MQHKQKELKVESRKLKVESRKLCRGCLKTIILYISDNQHVIVNNF
jgi:hypothetical protein